MLFRFFLAVVVTSALPTVHAQAVDFQSSDLPIILIDTEYEILDEPKVPARMQIVDNGPDVRNRVTDAANEYDGQIGIEIRGSFSQTYPKQQYGIETRDADGENNNVELLGMPAENDWVLSAPYVDKSLMRNVLTYRIARSMGRYAPRTRFVEVVLNGEYAGLHVLTESIKRDDARVDISNLKPDETSGDDLTGGYLFRSDRTQEGQGWTSRYPSSDPDAGVIRYGFREPKYDEIVPEQAAYIEEWMGDFEDAVMSGASYEEISEIADLDSFVDFLIVNELTRNPDAYRLSTYFHKDKDSRDPRLIAGPVWDFNTSYGGTSYLGGTGVENMMIDTDDFLTELYPRPRWWPVLFNDQTFQRAFRARWEELRQGVLHDDALRAAIEDLAAEVDEAQARNFQRWPVLGVEVWPNAYVGQTYADEIGYLQSWTLGRAAWMDGRLPVANGGSPAERVTSLSAPAPNPSATVSTVTVRVAEPQHMRVDLIDVTGRRIAGLFDGRIVDTHRVTIPTASLPAGLYLVRAVGGAEVATQTLTVAR